MSLRAIRLFEGSSGPELVGDNHGDLLSWDATVEAWKPVPAPSPPAVASGQLCLPAAGCWASLTNGATALAQLETTTNKVNYFVAEFLQATQSFVEWDLAMPADWDGGTVTAVFYWAASSASTSSVVWGLQGRAYADGAALDQAFGTAVEVTDANHGSDLLNISPATGPITLAGAPAGGQHVQFRAYRLGSGADNLAATANLLEVRITYGRD